MHWLGLISHKKNSEKKRFYQNRVGTNQLCRNDWLKYFMKFMKNAQGIIEIFWLLSEIFSVDPWNILAFSPISTRDDVAFMSILVETTPLNISKAGTLLFFILCMKGIKINKVTFQKSIWNIRTLDNCSNCLAPHQI